MSRQQPELATAQHAILHKLYKLSNKSQQLDAKQLLLVHDSMHVPTDPCVPLPACIQHTRNAAVVQHLIATLALRAGQAMV